MWKKEEIIERQRETEGVGRGAEKETVECLYVVSVGSTKSLRISYLTRTRRTWLEFVASLEFLLA